MSDNSVADSARDGGYLGEWVRVSYESRDFSSFVSYKLTLAVSPHGVFLWLPPPRRQAVNWCLC